MDNVCQKIMFALGRGRLCFCTSGSTLNGLCHFKFMMWTMVIILTNNLNSKSPEGQINLQVLWWEERGGRSSACSLSTSHGGFPWDMFHCGLPCLQSLHKSYHSTLKDSVKRFWEEAARRRHEQLQQGSKSYHFAQFAKWLSHDSQLAFG